MDIRTIQYFLEVAKECNITRAAENLHMAQPPLSRQMRQLEEELGVELFDRSKKRLKLTEEGVLLRNRGEEILSMIDKTREEVSELKNGIGGTLYIGTVEGRGPSLLAQWISSFTGQYPQVHYELWNGSTDDVVERMEKGLLDLALIAEPFDHERLDSIPVEIMPWVAMIPEEHPLAALPGNTIPLKLLVEEPLLIPSRKSRVREIEAWFDSFDHELNIVCEMSSFLNARELTRQAVGIAIFPKVDICYSPAGIVEKEIVDPVKTVDYKLVWDKQKELPALAERFLEHVKDCLENHTQPERK